MKMLLTILSLFSITFSALASPSPIFIGTLSCEDSDLRSISNEMGRAVQRNECEVVKISTHDDKGEPKLQRTFLSTRDSAETIKIASTLQGIKDPKLAKKVLGVIRQSKDIKSLAQEMSAFSPVACETVTQELRDAQAGLKSAESSYNFVKKQLACPAGTSSGSSGNSVGL